MSFWSKLKKIKVIDVVKKGLSFIPGGSSVKAGIETLEKTIKSATTKPKQTTTSDKIVTKEALKADETGTSGISPLLLIGGAIAVYFLLFKK